MILEGLGEKEMSTRRVGNRDAHGREREERQSEIGRRRGVVERDMVLDGVTQKWGE